MHPYATDSNKREQVLLALALLAVGSAWVLSRGMTAAHFSPPWWFDAPSTMTFYGLFFTFFDRVLWRKQILHRLGIVKVPVLTGSWQGHVISSYDKHSAKHDVGVQITQNWTKITILLQSKSSKSHSQVASIQVQAHEGVVLSYQYQNEPQRGAVQTMHTHRGTARLIYAESGSLSGDYYSGRDRQTNGSIHLERVT